MGEYRTTRLVWSNLTSCQTCLYNPMEQIADTLPQAARIVHEGVELIVVDYETWKEKVRRHQVLIASDESEENYGSANH